MPTTERLTPASDIGDAVDFNPSTIMWTLSYPKVDIQKRKELEALQRVLEGKDKERLVTLSQQSWNSFAR